MANFTENKTYKQVLDDSFGGIMYDVSNKGKYDAAELISEMEEYGINRLDGIAKGAYEFLKGES